MSKYKIGDEIIIRKDLVENEPYEEYTVDKDMLQYAGKKAVVMKVYAEGCDLNIDNGNYFWTDEMIEDLSNKVGLKLQVKYIDKNITPMIKEDGGDLVDLRVSRVFDCKYNYDINKLAQTEMGFPYKYKQGDTLFFKLGLAMKMPPNKKANVYPRSGMFKNYGFILTNSVGQIDNAFQGNTDEWGAMMYCTRDGEINYDDRILQFEVVDRVMENVKFEVVEELHSEDRGGYSSTGVK